MARYAIVIISVDSSRKDEAAALLGQALGIPAESTAPVLDAAPTILFDQLELLQGRKLLDALDKVRQAGCVIAVAEGASGRAALAWPGEPVVNGKPLSKYRISEESLQCPVCGSPLEANVKLLERVTPAQGGQALPDVPQLPKDKTNSNFTPAPKRSNSSATLDIAQVEKVWKERAGSSGKNNAAGSDTNRKAIAGEPPRSSSSALMEALNQAPVLGENDFGKYDILASGTSSPMLAQIIAKSRGIPLNEAQELAKRKIVPVAKNIDRKTADAIEAELKAANIKARIIPRKTSGAMPASGS